MLRNRVVTTLIALGALSTFSLSALAQGTTKPGDKKPGDKPTAGGKMSSDKKSGGAQRDEGVHGGALQWEGKGMRRVERSHQLVIGGVGASDDE